MDILQENRKLLDAFRRGEETALSQVYGAYAESLFAFLKNGFSFNSKGRKLFFRGYSASWQLEDAVQDIFFRAFRKESRMAYDGLRAYKNYLFSIARNRTVDYYRKNRIDHLDVRELQEIDEREMLNEHPVPSAEEISGNKELKDAVRQFIRDLTPMKAALFQIRFVDGESLEDAVKKTGLTDYRVKQHEREIKKQFFLCMQERGYFTGYIYRSRGVERLLASALILFGRGC